MSDAAVIDVGSNSVRLVLYRIEGRAMTPFFNEKVMAGLGRNLSTTGSLSPQGVEQALQALTRFGALIRAHDVRRVHAVATAAVRGAKDGASFAARVRAEAGVDLRIIDGAEEARLSALGVLAGTPSADGVVGDLGGSSLELIEVTPEGPMRGETFPLGPLSIMNGEMFDPVRIARVVDESLARSQVLRAQQRGRPFYAVGGAWRALGRVDIALRRHPLRVLHQHEMSRAEVLRVADFVAKQSRKSLEKFEEAAAKRADSLPYAAIVLERVIHLGGFDRVVLSSYGLREGLLAAEMGQEARAMDPLIAGAEAFAAGGARQCPFGRVLDDWIAPIFAAQEPVFGPDRAKVLRAAAARLSDLGGALHPDQRPGVMYDLVLRAPFAAISHPERAFLAAAVHHRYTRSAPENQAYERLLTDAQRRSAMVLGFALRLGADLSGRAEEILKDFSIVFADGALRLRVASNSRHMLTEQVVKRLESVAGALGAPISIEVG